MSYGSDNPDCIKVVGSDAALPVTPPRYSSKRWKKLLLATAGTALCVGSALAMFQGWSSYLTRARLASAPSGMFLASQYTSQVQTNLYLLKTGQEFMLRVRGKDNLCMDDGGGWTAGSTKFTNKPCNPSSPNQIFTYDPNTRLFSSVYKQGLCIDDGGSWSAGGTQAHLWNCDSNNQNQWFTVDFQTLMLRNPVKNNLCFDDGGGMTPGATNYWLWYCDSNSPNQHFEIVSRAEMAKEKQQMFGTTMYDLMVSGQDIMFRVRGKNNLCIDDGGSYNAGTTQFMDMPCNPDSQNQVFKYNINTGEFENSNKPGLCIDDGGSWTAGGTRAHLWYCDINNQNQWFDMDETTMMLRNPVKDNLCFDDGGGTTAASSKFVMWNCNNDSPNQHFEVVLRADMLELKQQTGLTPYDLLASGEEVMLRVRGKKNLCVDDGGAWGAGISPFVDERCNPDNPNQVFTYNIKTLEFQSVMKPGLCIDDGGGWDAGATTAHLWYCDPNNQNQWFVLDESTLMLHNPLKDNLCLDDGGGDNPAETKFRLWTCSDDNQNQHFEVVTRASMLEEKKKQVGLTPYDILTSGQEIMLRIRGKNNLCVDDGGGWGAAVTTFVDQPCDPDSPNQVYKYNVIAHEFENVNKPGLCIDDGGGWSAAGSTAHLWYCDPNNQNQWFVFDEETMMLHNPMKSNLCFDDGGGTTAGASQFIMWYCSDDNTDQHFEIMSRADFAEEIKMKRIAEGVDDEINLLNSGQNVMLRVRGKDNLCVDDGGGRSNGATAFNDQPCDPTSPDQVFTYDTKTHQFRSVHKAGLCIDDGGAWTAGGSQAHLWDCDQNNQNQWFVLDEDTMMFRNPAKSNLCFDDGGGTTPGASKYVLEFCNDDSPNQHFEILSQAKLADEKKQRDIATGVAEDVDLLNSGQQIMFRVRGKDNLCIDDGGGLWAGATPFASQKCNPDSPNQIFTYDTDTLQFKSANKPNLCLDDGGGWNAGQTTAHLWDCDPNNQNQLFIWDEDTMMLRNPAKDNLCFDDGGGATPGATNCWLWGCDNNNLNQHFEVVSAVAMAAEKKQARIAAGNTAGDVLASGQQVMLRVHGKGNVCVDDGGATSSNTALFMDQACNPDSPNQVFTYNAMTHQFQSVFKTGLCIGSWSGGNSPVMLWNCDPNNNNQWFVMDESTLMLHSVADDNMCLDDGGAITPGGSHMMLPCNEDSPNQHFEVLPHAMMVEEKKKSLIAAGVDDDIDLLNTGQQLMLRVRGKNNLCADDGGGHSKGETEFANQPCDPTSPNQIFTYDAGTHQFRSVNKPGLCLDDGGGSSPAETLARLWDCDPTNQDQWFILDQDNMMLRSASKNNLCFDDGGGTTPGATKYWLWTCDPNDPNQHYEIISPSSLPQPQGGTQTSDKPGTNYLDLLQSGMQILIRSHENGDLCLDDGGGHSNGETDFVYQPCDPNSQNQIFSYDVNVREFRSVNKPGLCLDDGGGRNPGETTFHLWQCDPANVNQWFVLDPDSLLLHNPAKPNVCLANDGGMVPGSKFTLADCNNGNPIQQFEILSRGDLLGRSFMPPPPMPAPVVDSPLLTIDTGNDALPAPQINEILPPPIVDDNGIVQPPEVVPSNGLTGTGQGSAPNDLTGVGTQPGQGSAPNDLTGGGVPNDLTGGQGGGTPAQPLGQFEDAPAGSFSQPQSIDNTGNPSAGTGSSNPSPPNADVLPTNPVPISPVVLPDQEAANLPPPNVPIVEKADMPLADYGNGDWNLLSPSNDTIILVNADNSSAISAAEIFTYLQSVKNDADMEHEVMMYRYKRTYQCATEGLKTLAKDAVTNDQYHVLVQWMYDHCAAGATDVAPIDNPSPPTDDQTKSDDVAPLVDDTDVKRQYMTKLDFYYEIKNHYADKNADLVGNAAVANLRAAETEKLEKMLVDCIEEASERFGYNQDKTSADDASDHLTDAINWVESTCMAS